LKTIQLYGADGVVTNILFLLDLSLVPGPSSAYPYLWWLLYKELHVRNLLKKCDSKLHSR